MSTEEETTRQINDLIAKMQALPKAELAAKNGDIKAMISYYTTLTREVEDRRTKYYQFSLQSAAVLIAAIGLLVAVQESLPRILSWYLLPSVGIQLLSAIVSIALFVAQSYFRYPFLQLEGLANQWKWFYYGNPAVLGISERTVFPSRDPHHTTIPYLEGLRSFIQHYVDESPTSEISANVIQLYLLQVHNYFKNRFYLQLYNVSRISLVVTVVYILAISIFALSCVGCASCSLLR